MSRTDSPPEELSGPPTESPDRPAEPDSPLVVLRADTLLDNLSREGVLLDNLSREGVLLDNLSCEGVLLDNLSCDGVLAREVSA